MSKTKSFQAEVWDTLSKLDVSQHVQKKMNLSYLSWAWAWGELMAIYPESEYSFTHSEPIPEGGWEVWCTLIVRKGEQSLVRKIWLPIMDFKNNAIVKPTVRDLSDTRMRCLVKAMAICGLGHYIYAGEDVVPNPEPKKRVNKSQVQEYIPALLSALENNDEVGAAQLMDELRGTPEQTAVWGAFTTKQKSAIKTLVTGVSRDSKG